MSDISKKFPLPSKLAEFYDYDEDVIDKEKIVEIHFVNGPRGTIPRFIIHYEKRGINKPIKDVYNQGIIILKKENYSFDEYDVDIKKLNDDGFIAIRKNDDGVYLVRFDLGRRNIDFDSLKEKEYIKEKIIKNNPVVVEEKEIEEIPTNIEETNVFVEQTIVEEPIMEENQIEDEILEPITEEKSKKDDKNSPWDCDSIEFLSKSELLKKNCSLVERADNEGFYKIKKGALGMTVTADKLVKLGLAVEVIKEEVFKEKEYEKEIEKKEYSDEEKESIKKWLEEFSLTIYEKKPSSEQDAYPYLDDELMVVCDGAGGSGAAMHEIDNPRDINSYEKLSKIVLPQDKAHELKDFFVLQFNEIIDNPEIPRASAFWASRVLIVNFVYAFKNISHDPKVLNSFCQEALDRVARKFRFKVSLSSQIIEPSTLAAIYIKEENEKEVKVDVMWTGDSRASILTSDGYKPISRDHEDARGGAMNNIFAAFRNSYTEEKSLTFKKPFVLVSASDGTFDDRKDWYVEKLFLDSIMKANDINELKANLKETYKQPSKNGKPDDTTIALRLFGYKDYNELKESLETRYNHINNISNLFFKNISFNMVDGGFSEIEGDYKDFVNRCIKGRIKEISSIFSDDLISNNKEDIIPLYVYDEVSNYIQEKNKNYQKEYADFTKKTISNILDLLKYRENTPILNEVFDINNDKFIQLCIDNKVDISVMINSLINIKKTNELKMTYEVESSDYKKEMKEFINLINGLINVADKLGYKSMEYKNIIDNNLRLKDITFGDEELELLDKAGYLSVYKKYRNLIHARKEYIELTNNDDKFFVESNINAYNFNLGLIKNINDTITLYEALTDEFKEKYCFVVKKVNKEKVFEKVFELINNEKACQEIADLVIKHKVNDTNIKLYINQSLLNKSILYKDICEHPEILEEKAEYDKLENEYNLKWDEFIK